MKKNFKYALMSAIAVVGVVSFSACSSNEEVVDNPNYNPETNSVKTAITLSIDPNGSAKTRMAEATAQIGTGTFRGMQDIWLIPSTSIENATSTTSKIELGSISTTKGASGFDSDKDTQKTYTDKEVPVGTTNFLLLGKATRGDVSTVAGKLANGYTTNNIGAGSDFTAATVGAIAINAEGIAPVSGETPALTDDWNTPATNLATYLTNIANAAGWAATTNPNLQNLRNTFLNASLTAGSSASILLTLERLYNAVHEQTDASVVTAIKTAITTANLQVKSGTDAPTAKLEWQTSPTVLKNFPENLGLPEGAAQYQWNTTSSKFEYVTEPTLNASNTAVMSIVYPNELYYLTNTALKATDTKTITWPTNVGDWTNATWGSWTDVVQANSKNIALINNVQYGTALLSSTVKSEASVLYDNAKAVDPDQPEENRAITVTDNSFPLTGVLVGGQPSSVAWNFLPSGTEFAKVVYDANVPSGINAGATTQSSKNYTLVFDNLTSDNEQKDVNICLEFTNNSGSDFYGSNGIILKGQKFYIVGKLTIGNNSFPFPTVGSVQTTASDIASITRSYYPSLTPRVFIQDFETIANFTLTAGDANTAGSLGKAIVTIPDLRSTNQTLGLSVDLSWRPGLTFDINLGQ